MSDTELIGLTLLMAVVTGLIVWGFIKHAEQEKIRKKFIADNGFVGCKDEKKNLSEQITRLENNSEYSYSIREPMKTSLGEGDVFFYTKDRRRRNDLHVAYEFLFPVKRKARLPFQIFVKPASMQEGMTSRLLRDSTTTGWDSQSDDLVKLELPAELKASNILGVMGPSNHRVQDLFDSATIQLLDQAGNHDVFTLRSRDEMCSIEIPLTGHKCDYEKVWSYIKRLMQAGI
ncbi:hypothetical protein MNBD_GAMMA15-1539 [hydrothermal vent metagenome]|uniref:Uncharacterized protein n=1 Tax=hydrothermal vent metagenome TaxID=652676 RepID=A0A3B0YEE8_9ZZZZ